MKAEKREKAKFIYSVVSLFLTACFLVMAFTTFCWISTNKKVTSTGAFIKLDPASGMSAENILILKRDGARGAKNVAADRDTVLTEYDTVFTDKNVDTPIIIMAELANPPKYEDGSYMPISIVLYWTDGGNANSWKDKSGNMTPVLSNIIDVRCIADQSLDSLTAYDEIYNRCIEYIPQKAGVSGTKAFVNKGTDGKYTKTPYLHFVITDHVDSIHLVNGIETFKIYIELNYNADLINEYNTEHVQDIAGDVVYFTSDLTNFYFKDGDEIS